MGCSDAKSVSIPDGDRHIGLFQVLLIGMACSFVSAWFAVAAWLLVTILAYGLFGVEIYPPSLRVISFVFSAVFVIVIAAGTGSWVNDKVRSILKAKAQGEGNG